MLTILVAYPNTTMASGSDNVPKPPVEGDAELTGPALREQYRKTAEALAAATAKEVELLHEITAHQGRVISNLEEQVRLLKFHLHILRHEDD